MRVRAASISSMRGLEMEAVVCLITNMGNGDRGAVFRAGRDLPLSISPSSPYSTTSSMLKGKDFFFGFLCMLHAYLHG